MATKKKEINGLSLIDYKDIEREATESLRSAKKMVLVSSLMLRNAEVCILDLGGKTNEMENDLARSARGDDGNVEV